MPRAIEAVYEDGVFKPLEKIDLKDHERVELKVFPKDEWQLRFHKLIKSIQKKSVKYSEEEIDADIIGAIKEVRQDKRGH